MVHRWLVGVASFLALVSPVLALDLPNSKQTSLALYLSAQETPAFLQENPEALFIDVRTPDEIDASGLAEGVDALLPVQLFDAKKGMIYNPQFFQGLRTLALSQGLAADHPIVVICRSGNRSATVADAMAKVGFTQVYTVTDGYEGDRGATGARDVNGWKNAGLPWQDRPASSCAPTVEGGQC